MSSISFRSRRIRRRADLSVTPLIDVLFLLVIFFTLTSTFRQIGQLELRLPDSATASLAAPEKEIHLVEVIATEAGRLMLDGKDVEIPELRERLSEIVRADAEARVTIKAEAGVLHGDVVSLLDLVRNAGFPGVAIGTHVQIGASAH